ncbi:hypothetical protein KV113_06965 [Mycolicibacter sp. MYC340]|uniref:Uncharacterized protein n=1 Tax=[Mycobacterium] nativiensis TaxID=2855503 RepID=A0ABU5XU09_9MYCO|nr:hypothetical protein [Mycolicibacter sp. MYC340]
MPGEIPPLSELLAWTTDHLIAGATDMDATADRWETVFIGMSKDLRSAGWEGESATGARIRIASDHTQVSEGAEKLRAGATVARSGASDVLSAQNRLRYAIEDANEAGFNVYENCTVEDTTGRGGAARHAQAEQFATDIYGRAKHLVAVDIQVSRRISQTTGDVGNYFNFHEEDGSGNRGKPKIHLVDHKTGGDDPSSIHNSDDVHRKVDPLPPGRHPNVKVLETSEQIRQLYDELTQNATPIPPGSYPGEWKVLEDGTKIGFRTDSKFGGPTTEVWYPGSKDSVDIHLRDRPAKEPISIGALIITLIAGLGSLATAPHLVGH